MAKEFVRNIKETKLRGKNIEPLYTNEQNDLLSDKEHAYIRNNDYYFPLTQAILDLASANDDGKNPVKPKLNIDGKENKVTLEWDTKTLGNNFVERTPITLTVDDEFNQIIIGIDQEALYRFIKPYFKSSKDITVDFDDEKKTISYRLDDQAFFERLVSHFKDGNGLDFVIDNEFKTVHYNLKDDKIKSIIFDTVEAKDDDLAVEQEDGKLLIDLSEKNTNLLAEHSANIEQHSSDIEILKETDKTHNELINENHDNIENLELVVNSNKTRIDNISDDLTDNALLLSIDYMIGKYHEKKVKKVTPKKYTEGIPQKTLPSFYEMNLKEGTIKLTEDNNPYYTTQPGNSEKLLLIDFGEKIFIVNITKTNDVNNVTKNDINKYNKELKSLKVTGNEKDGFKAIFDEDIMDYIFYDLYTINSLEKI